LGLTFFGLTPTYRINLFKTIHEIVFHGGGGYDWHTVYEMPVWLRTFTFNVLKEHFDQIKQKQDEQNNVMTNQQTSKKEIARPNIAPKSAYTTTNKAPNP
jgi:hypothetical protein